MSCSAITLTTCSPHRKRSTSCWPIKLLLVRRTMSPWATLAPILKAICREGSTSWMEILAGLEILLSQSPRMTTTMFMISTSPIGFSVFQWTLIITTIKVAPRSLWSSLTNISCFNISKIWNIIEQLPNKMHQATLAGHLQCSILIISFWVHQTTMIVRWWWIKLKIITGGITQVSALITKL